MSRGINILEVPTSLQPPVIVGAGLPFVVGSAPVNMTESPSVNKAVLVSTYDEAVAAFGFVPADKQTGLFEFTLCEFMKSWFQLFGGGPVVFVNVLDPAAHNEVIPAYDVELDRDRGTLLHSGVVLSTVVVMDATGETTYVLGSDYDFTFDADGKVILHRIEGGDIAQSATVRVNYTRLDPSAVDGDDIVGGVDVDGNKSGLELIVDVFPKTRLVPGFIAAPGFSGSAAVAAVMKAKAQKINGNFNAMAVIDIPTDTVTKYADAGAWKNNNSITDTCQIACWPMVSLGGEKYHMGTQLIALANQVDDARGGVPSESPSNKNLQMDSMVLRSGVEVVMGTDVASMLNAQGVVTATNFTNGWVLWGNRTGAYPGSSDVKDAFIPIRRMFNWTGNSIILTYFGRLDQPLTPNLIQIIVDSINTWFNGLVADGHLLGGEAQFLESDNPLTSLLDGKVKIRVRLTPPPPFEQGDFVLEYDPQGLTTLFS